MDQKEANRNIKQLRDKSILSPEDEFLYTESLEYMIAETKDPDYMIELGGYCYEQKNFDLALKYYEMAYTYGNTWAAEGLGYIWYYGRTGERDYEKAFRYYSEAAENGYLLSKIKVSDMYRNGYYVDQNKEEYIRIIEEAKKDVEHPQYLNEPYPEIYTRLAKIRIEEGRNGQPPTT